MVPSDNHAILRGCAQEICRHCIRRVLRMEATGPSRTLSRNVEAVVLALEKRGVSITEISYVCRLVFSPSRLPWTFSSTRNIARSLAFRQSAVTWIRSNLRRPRGREPVEKSGPQYVLGGFTSHERESDLARPRSSDGLKFPDALPNRNLQVLDYHSHRQLLPAQLLPPPQHPGVSLHSSG